MSLCMNCLHFPASATAPSIQLFCKTQPQPQLSRHECVPRQNSNAHLEQGALGPRDDKAAADAAAPRHSRGDCAVRRRRPSQQGLRSRSDTSLKNIPIKILLQHTGYHSFEILLRSTSLPTAMQILRRKEAANRQDMKLSACLDGVGQAQLSWQDVDALEVEPLVVARHPVQRVPVVHHEQHRHLKELIAQLRASVHLHNNAACGGRWDKQRILQ